MIWFFLSQFYRGVQDRFFWVGRLKDLIIIGLWNWRGRNFSGFFGGGMKNERSMRVVLFWFVFLVIKEFVLFSVEESLDVELQRRRGSDSFTKKFLFLFSGEGFIVSRVEFLSFVLGLGMGFGLSGLGFIGRVSFLVFSCEREVKKIIFNVIF